MLNGEKFRDEILKVDASISYVIYTKYLGFNSEDYVNKTYKETNEGVLNWLLSEYKEPIKLSRLEYGILKLLKEKNYIYLVRDSEKPNNERYSLYAYNKAPKRNHNEKAWAWSYECAPLNVFEDLFQFVKWEDDEPTLIQDVLDNCIVIDNESEEDNHD